MDNLLLTNLQLFIDSLQFKIKSLNERLDILIHRQIQYGELSPTELQSLTTTKTDLQFYINICKSQIELYQTISEKECNHTINKEDNK